jgi:hypothetical protein
MTPCIAIVNDRPCKHNGRKAFGGYCLIHYSKIRFEGKIKKYKKVIKPVDEHVWKKCNLFKNGSSFKCVNCSITKYVAYSEKKFKCGGKK